ncbi:MAG TPA: hypothetical protein PK829_06065 [Promineifilum sp.]|nr:hypothetical protein [Promineifilum sp.]
MTTDTNAPWPVDPWQGNDTGPVFGSGSQDDEPSPDVLPPADGPGGFEQRAPQRLIIKTREGAFASYQDRLEEQLGEQLGSGWAELHERYPDLTIGRAFRGIEGNDDSVPPEVLTYYEILLPPDQALEVGRAASILLERLSDQIEFTYIEAPPAPQPTCSGVPRPYLNAAPRGMNVLPFQGSAADAWPVVVDLERAWDATSHPRVAHVGVLPGFAGPSPADGYARFVGEDLHATRSLSVLTAAENPVTHDCAGLLPANAPVFMASSLVWEPDGWVERINSQIELVTKPGNGMQAGDILLIELQIPGRDRHGCVEVLAPIELEPANQAALATALSRGIIVIEPAGNGGTNLTHLKLWDRCQAGSVRGVNALCVAACCAIAPEDIAPVRLLASNFGSAVTFFSWGENIPTNVLPALELYGETSAASALIAGIAARVQSAAMTRGSGRLNIDQLRAALQLGATLAPGQSIGVMPKLNP